MTRLGQRSLVKSESSSSAARRSHGSARHCNCLHRVDRIAWARLRNGHPRTKDTQSFGFASGCRVGSLASCADCFWLGRRRSSWCGSWRGDNRPCLFFGVRHRHACARSCDGATDRTIHDGRWRYKAARGSIAVLGDRRYFGCAVRCLPRKLSVCRCQAEARHPLRTMHPLRSAVGCPNHLIVSGLS